MNPGSANKEIGKMKWENDKSSNILKEDCCYEPLKIHSTRVSLRIGQTKAQKSPSEDRESRHIDFIITIHHWLWNILD